MSPTPQPSTILTDASGRTIEFKPLNPGEQFKLVRVLGKNSTNEIYMSMALMAASVRTIADVPVPFPMREDSIENLLNQLGDEGLEAIKAHIQPAAVDGNVSNEDAVMESAKN